ncbi:Protein of unknown function [Sphingomonas guangdongensis]|uniref:DUF2946 domain-containing protein n=1 Tax=Sphingomonas guangdongensis TaxID=1141890 RepID=A0A285QWR1_9SPHN|nr:DUF2946 family protein [Sphingomonas guangdongensis]SOB86400.1 Protein of unknown function [Sphingomonas guangdongensis]
MSARRHLTAHRRCAGLILALALLVKLLVPAGYMVDRGGGHIVITICSGTAPRQMTMDMGGKHHEGSGDRGATADMPCAFAGLAAPVLGPIDPLQLALLIAFVLALGVARSVPGAPAPPVHLRPPLRGPPILA